MYLICNSLSSDLPIHSCSAPGGLVMIQIIIATLSYSFLAQPRQIFITGDFSPSQSPNTVASTTRATALALPAQCKNVPEVSKLCLETSI